MVVLWGPLIAAVGLLGQASSARLPRNWAGTAILPVESNVSSTEHMPLNAPNKPGAVFIRPIETTRTMSVERTETSSPTTRIAPTLEEALPAEVPSSIEVDIITSNDVMHTETTNQPGKPTILPAESAIIGEHSTPNVCGLTVTVTVTKWKSDEDIMPALITKDPSPTSTATSSVTLTLQNSIGGQIPSLPIIGDHDTELGTHQPGEATNKPCAPLPSSSLRQGTRTQGWNTFTSAIIAYNSEKNAVPQAGADRAELPVSLLPALVPTGYLNRRWQVGDVVVVTMDGRVVSWLNEWDGKPTLTVGASSRPTITTETSKPEKTTMVPQSEVSTPSAPSTCGEIGNFEIDNWEHLLTFLSTKFDDLPAYSTPDEDTTSSPPIFSPYRHFFWSGGWSYGPPPRIPFTPESSPHVGVYTPDQNPGKGDKRGGFGCGPRAKNQIYWFDASSAQFGCANAGVNETCVVQVSASRYSDGFETPAGNASFNISPCSEQTKCKLTPIGFGGDFRGIADIRFEATVSGKAVKWYIDDLQLSWHDDSCEAGLQRQRTRK